VSIAGDDDQAIFQWAGADVDYLINMKGTARVLGQSYRVPPVVQEVADGVISEVKHRREKVWSARKGDRGEVERQMHFDDVDVDAGTTLVLARNSYVLRDQIEPELRRRGIVYEKNGASSIRQSYLHAIEVWEQLRAGKPVPVDEARVAYEYLSVGEGVARGHKKLPGFADDADVTMDTLEKEGGLLTRAIWHEALTRLPPSEITYMLAARRRGEKLRSKPRVRVSTIHASKGGEADHVVLMKEMASRTHLEMQRNPEDEARVWYVGVTRARKKLTIVESSTKRACPWV
jgi:DNA helicase-2/ATP-dependent DNA helicase PcrA